MISLKDFASAMKPDTRLYVDRRDVVGPTVETTTGEAWFELVTTGQDMMVDHISPHEGYVVVTVSPMEGRTA